MSCSPTVTLELHLWAPPYTPPGAAVFLWNVFSQTMTVGLKPVALPEGVGIYGRPPGPYLQRAQAHPVPPFFSLGPLMQSKEIRATYSLVAHCAQKGAHPIPGCTEGKGRPGPIPVPVGGLALPARATVTSGGPRPHWGAPPEVPIGGARAHVCALCPYGGANKDDIFYMITAEAPTRSQAPVPRRCLGATRGGG